MDEVFTWWSARVGHPLALRDLAQDLHGPLFSLIVHAWTGWAGDGEAMMRLPSALCGIAAVPAMGWLAARWLGRETAAPAAWLTAGSPFLVWYSQEARNYSLLLLCTILACGAALGLARAPRVRTAAAAALASIAALLSNLSFLLVLPVQAVWWWGPRAGRGRRVALLAGVLGALALAALPFAPQALRTWDWARLDPRHAQEAGAIPLRGAPAFHAAALPFALHAFAVGYTLGPPLRELRAAPGPRTVLRHAPELAAVALVFGALGLLGLRAISRRRHLAELLLWLALPAVLLGWIASSQFKVFHPRYLMVCVPAFLLTLAAGLADASRARRGALGVAVGALWVASLAHHYFDPRYGKEDYRGMAAILRTRAAADERIVSVNTDDPLAYYYRGPLRVVPIWLGYATRPARLDSVLTRAMAGAGGVWVVESRWEDLDPSGAFARRLDARYPDAERWSGEGVRLWHVRPGVTRPLPSGNTPPEP